MVNQGWADPGRGLFSISAAAELSGLHPQTLRIYEREGLVDPARSAGGTRRYSQRDIDRLHEICVLTGEGLNMAGIRRVLQLQEETRQLQAEVAGCGNGPVAAAGLAAIPGREATAAERLATSEVGEDDARRSGAAPGRPDILAAERIGRTG